MTTPRLGLLELAQNQSQPHVPVNTALRRLDALVQPVVLGFITELPGTQEDGDAYIVESSGTIGDLIGKENYLAYYSGGWAYVPPFYGLRVLNRYDHSEYLYDDTTSPAGWSIFTTGGGGGGAVDSVAGRTGDVVLTAEDLTDLASANGAAQLDSGGKVPAAQLPLGTAGGAASLDGGGKVPVGQLPSSIVGGVSYQGTWNATTNSPDLAGSSPAKGYYYVVATAGSTSLGGITDWKIGDWAIYNGSAWEKVDNSEDVTSVAGRTGAVVITSTDLSDFTEAAQDAVGAALTDSSTVDFTYNDGANTITAVVIDDSITYAKMQNISATARILGRKTAGAGDTEELAASDVIALLASLLIVEYQVALSDMTTAITTGTTKAYMRAPRAFTLTGVRSSLSVVSSSGIPTVDINVNGSTILSTKLTIDASEKTSVTAATAAVISGSPLAIADDDLIEFDIDVAGTGAKGLIVTLIGHV